jgi:hypothetical protein
MSSRKRCRKAKVDHEAVIETMHEKNKKAARVEEASTLKDNELFAVNINKDGLQKKRAKLAKDRFKLTQEKLNGHLKSKTEQALLKKIKDKQTPSAPPVKEEKVDDFVDLWATP